MTEATQQADLLVAAGVIALALVAFIAVLYLSSGNSKQRKEGDSTQGGTTMEGQKVRRSTRAHHAPQAYEPEVASPRPRKVATAAAATPAKTPASPKAARTPKSPRSGVTSPARFRKTAAKTPAKTPASPKSPRAGVTSPTRKRAARKAA